MFKKLIFLILTQLLLNPSFSQIGPPNRVEDSDLYDYTENEKAAKFYEKGYKSFHFYKFKKAAKLYKKAIKEDPDFVEAYDNLGLSYRQIGELDSAQKYYLRSLELYPNGMLALQNIAVVYMKKGATKKALESFKKVNEVDPENPEGYYGCAQVYLEQEEYEKALESGLLAEEYYKKQESGYIQDSQYLIGLAYYKLDDIANAKKYFQLAKDAGIGIPYDIKKELGLR